MTSAVVSSPGTPGNIDSRKNARSLMRMCFYSSIPAMVALTVGTVQAIQGGAELETGMKASLYWPLGMLAVCCSTPFCLVGMALLCDDIEHASYGIRRSAIAALGQSILCLVVVLFIAVVQCGAFYAIARWGTDPLTFYLPCVGAAAAVILGWLLAKWVL